MRIILASASPRRRELLTQIVPEFDVIASDEEEVITREVPSEIAAELASLKAESVLQMMRNEEEDLLIIGADTIVVLEDRILGKPADEADAFRMLSGLSGKVHQVFTGICLIGREKGRVKRNTFYEQTDVEFCPMTDEEIRSYIRSGDPFDKAGAYGIQSGCGKYIRGISGDFYNVVGLPLARLYHEIRNFIPSW